MQFNVLYISYDGLTDPLGQSQILPYLTALSTKGYRITILSCEKQERAQHRDTVKEICTKYHINWQPILYTKSPPILSTIKDVRKLKKIALSLHKQINFDIVHCRSYIATLVGLWLKKTQSIPFVFDMRGFWANERVDGGLWKLNNPVYKKVYQYFKNKEVTFLQQADAIISLTHEAKNEINSWGLKTVPITVIPCCVDTTLFNPEIIERVKLASLKRKVDLVDNKKIILGYLGSLGTWYMLDKMIAFFATWLKQMPNSIFLFVSNEPKELILKSLRLHHIDSSNVRIVNATRKEIPYFISMMDFGIFFIKNAYSKKASSPVKQGEMMAMGLPLICNANIGDTDYIINNYHSGVLVKDFKTAEYEHAINQLKENIVHPEQIRNGAIDYFDLGKGVDTYDKVYKSLVNK